MNRYQDFYKDQRERKAPSNHENRRSVFNRVRKERRTQMFDLFRGDIAASEPEAIKPVPKFTFRDTINKLIREKKKRVIQKPLPFVVGTVKHKIHSPPFLHGRSGSKETKKKLIPSVQKSFAPNNYKFKIPKGLAVNLNTPLGEENSIGTPFALNTVWNKLNNKTTRKEFMHKNVTLREKKKNHVEASPNDAHSTANVKAEQKGAKRELWPEAFDEGPIFGRLNMERMSRSLDSQHEDSENEGNESPQHNIEHPVLTNTSLSSSDNEFNKQGNIQNLDLEVDVNIKLNTASMSAELIQDPVISTARMSNKFESEMQTPSEETTHMDNRLSRISPPKIILSNSIFNFEDTEVYTEKDNINLENIELPCSTPSLQNFFKDIQVQFEKSSDASIISTPSAIEDTVKESLLDHKDSKIEAATSTHNPVEESPTIHDNSRIGGRNLIIESERISLDIESSGNAQKILNLTFTKTLGLIEENEEDDEEEETIKLNLEYLNKQHKKEDIMNSSLVSETLNSSNVNEANIQSENLHKAGDDKISYDDVSKSKESSLVIENNQNSKEIPSLSKSIVQDNCIDQIIDVIQNNTVSHENSSEKINEDITKTIPELVSNQTDFDKDESLKNPLKTPVKAVSKVNMELNSSKKLDNNEHQEQETESLHNSLKPSRDQQNKVNYAETENNKNSCGPRNMASISLSSRKISVNMDLNSDAEAQSSSILFEDQPIGFNRVESTSGDSNKCNSDPCNLSSMNNFNRRVTENKNVNSDTKSDTDHSEAKEKEQIIATTNSKSKDTSLVIENNQNSKEISSLSECIVQDNCIDQIIDAIENNTVSHEKSSEKINEDITYTSPELVSNQTDLDKDESLKNPLETPVQAVQKLNNELNSSKKLDNNQPQAQETESLRNGLKPSRDQQNKVNYAEIENNKNSCGPRNMSSISLSSRRIPVNMDLNSNAEAQSTGANRVESTSGDNNKDNSDLCNLSSMSTSNRRVTESKNVNSDTESDSDHSEAKEEEEIVTTTNSTSSNSSVFYEDRPTEVEHVEPTSGDNNENCNSSRTSSLIDSTDCGIAEENNTSFGKIVYSCPTKLIDNIESIDQFLTSDDLSEVNIATPSQVVKEKNTTVETQRLPDSMGAKYIITNETSKLRDSSPVSEVQAKISSPCELEKPVVQQYAVDKIAHAGSVKSCTASINEPIIDLTESPVLANRKSIKSDLRKSALDYKSSPFISPNPKRNSLLSGSDENAVVDLVSDDEDTHTAFINSLLKKYATTSESPKQSPRNRSPLASIGNYPRFSASRISQSPLVRINSPAEKTPVPIVDKIPTVHVSPVVVPLEALHDTPRKTPRRRKALQDITTEIAEAPSPLRLLSLRSRNISVSPSPKKKTPRAVTPRKTPVKYNAVKKIVEEVTDDTGHLRVMNLRSRKVNVSPSPKKMTPRRRKNDKQCA